MNDEGCSTEDDDMRVGQAAAAAAAAAGGGGGGADASGDEVAAVSSEADEVDKDGDVVPFPEATMIQRQRSTESALHQWLEKIELVDYINALMDMGVTCLADCVFVEYEDLVGDSIGMNIIQARKFLQSRDKNTAILVGDDNNGDDDDDVQLETTKPPVLPPPPIASTRIASRDMRHSGPVLKKGYLPVGPVFNERQLNRIRNRRYDPSNGGKWVKRDIPLNDEELECWQEQASWLKCPITGKEWINASTVLGVGIYHAPRQVSDEEKQRMIDWEKANALLNRVTKSKQEAAGGVADGGSDPWWSTFYVYPNVDPPDKPFDESLLPPIFGGGDGKDDAEAVQMGRIELIIGPAFDVTAYNVGIHGGKLVLGNTGATTTTVRSKKKRGVRHDDAQWNAMNFEYWVSRDGGDNFIKKRCTNRLSFYIEGFHGQRVFPKNIRSQLSLMLWRDRNRLKLHNGSTDEKLLAVAIRKVLPRILLGAIMEMYRGTSTAKNNKQCSDQYIEYAMRTYLLIHQVSIKLVVYFQRTRDELLETVLRWIMAPFSAQAQREWPHNGIGLLEFLIGASLVGVPWHLVREPFMRALFTQLVRSCPELKWRHGQESRARWLRHIFQKQRTYLHQVMFVFTFFGTGRTVGELDRMYERCAGTLPRKERDSMKARVDEVKDKVDSIETLWVCMGMEVHKTASDRTEIGEHIVKMLKFCSEADSGRVGPRDCHWRLSDLPTDAVTASVNDEQQLLLSTRRLKGFSDVVNAWAAYSDTLDGASAMAAERAKHVGYPTLNQSGTLDRLVCNYEGCGRRFRHRDHLFRHLRQMVGDHRMVEAYHQSHFRLTRGQLTPNEFFATSCPACGDVFPTNSDLRDHLRKIAGFVFGQGQNKKEATGNATDHVPSHGNAGTLDRLLELYYSDPYCCVTCRANSSSGQGNELPPSPREVLLLPCGHLYACRTCGVRQARCVVCDQVCTDVVTVAHLEGEVQHATTPHNAMCVVCLAEPVTHIVVPCGHPCLCENCAQQVEPTGVCPVGRCTIQSIVRVYGTVTK